MQLHPRTKEKLPRGSFIRRRVERNIEQRRSSLRRQRRGKLWRAERVPSADPRSSIFVEYDATAARHGSFPAGTDAAPWRLRRAECPSIAAARRTLFGTKMPSFTSSTSVHLKIAMRM